MIKDPNITFGQDLVKLIAEIDEFKSKWEALQYISPDRLNVLRKVATIESIGSSTRIEGAKLTNAQVEELLSNIQSTSFRNRDEQEVAGYAETMDLVFQGYEDMRITENHIKQLHQILLKHSNKDERHRGSYKTLDNHVVAYDEDGKGFADELPAHCFTFGGGNRGVLQKRLGQDDSRQFDQHLGQVFKLKDSADDLPGLKVFPQPVIFVGDGGGPVLGHRLNPRNIAS
jgi:hypothetical protein